MDSHIKPEYDRVTRNTIKRITQFKEKKRGSLHLQQMATSCLVVYLAISPEKRAEQYKIYNKD